MGRSTELVTHIIKNTSDLCMMEEHGEFDLMMEELTKMLKPYRRIKEVHIERGHDVVVKCWEDVWTSGM